ncbi:heavy metal-responsive transcriptional regulator [Stenotrophomonas sp. MMGLT7]|uniref:heavy metal-responsive transcriptional regulator n=1 Tax=Stenotrophomonas sp. MMGLT7 TaxID=2901227 RepID=UPI001E40689D|nr:heavy metal-responsive transcriptional regulator [Stenotrophomonas sp. MMGLT7]MCD7098426.1 heavy metal-responsive transcriptional regulator [Stenotrophomonas sp. MMGLT7]
MSPARASSRFTIGALARQSEVAIDTIRYYEREGLLPLPQRRASGYREYDARAVERVRFIRRAKGLGFSLREIGDLLELQGDREHGVEGIKQRAGKRLDELDRRIARLTETRDALARLVDECPGGGEPECCPILADIQGEPVSPPAMRCGKHAPAGERDR